MQGVGLRPHVLREATRRGLAGEVRNDGADVVLEIEGDPGHLDSFLDAVRGAPAPARVDSLEVSPGAPTGETGVRIGESAGVPAGPCLAPDLGPCAACLAELTGQGSVGPGDRRRGYPFVACPSCGPRWTIVEGLPFDRARTAMAAFPPCAACAAEGRDPADRRLHAQGHACPACGPRLWFEPAAGPRSPRSGAPQGDPLAAAVALLRAGGVLALKGVGGWQLACDAADPTAVARLRAAKRRPEKPLALLVADVAAAAALVELPPGATAALAAPARPIVLLDRLASARVADGVSGLPTLGVMLPASPLHALLAVGFAGPLVLSSGNLEGEPIVVDDGAARGLADGAGRLAADGWLGHDRAIVARADDSVVRLYRGRPRVLRRARGFVPGVVRLPVVAGAGTPDLVAFGGDLHGALCVIRGDAAVLSPHLGDLDVPAVAEAAREVQARLVGLLGARPALAACDAHPDFVGARLARESGLPVVPVHHHHAHAAAVLAEHGRTGPALAAIFDGFGLGPDGTAWGGELLVASLTDARRVGRLRPVVLPGGDAAARSPWRSALAHLVAAGVEADPPALAAVDPPLRAAHRALCGRGPSRLASATSSAGRLFDAAAALLGLGLESAYEAQAPLALEALAGDDLAPIDPAEAGELRLDLVDGALLESAPHELLELDPRPLVRALVPGDARRLARAFHAALADGLVRALALLAERERLTTVLLGGGCFANHALLRLVEDGLRARGLEPLTSWEVPPGDGGLALGQAAVAAARARG